jgi:trehalose-phosphatase
MSAARHLLRAWPELRRGLRRAKRRALFTDYDGTLAPIRRRPEQARLGPRMREALRAAARASDVTGVVSGRRLEDVQSLVGLDGIWYTGVHGYFLRSPRGRQYSLLEMGRKRATARLTRKLKYRLRGLKGIDVEFKGATVAVHYRRAGSGVATRARAIVHGQARNGFALLQGKKVWEFVPAGRGREVNKWTGIEFILRRSGFRRRDHAAVIYLGDDATDEHVFRKLQGITVAVGKRQRTAARYYLRSTAEVRRFLQLWKEVSP